MGQCYCEKVAQVDSHNHVFLGSFQIAEALLLEASPLLERCVMHVPSIAHPSIHCGFESGETSKAEIFSDIMTSSPLAVAVVGAGAAGLCAARHLASNPQVICNHTHYY